MAISSSDDELPREVLQKVLVRVLENLRRALYCMQACNGIVRGAPTYSGPQIFPLAKDALYQQAILRAARAFDHHPRAASYFLPARLHADIVAEVATAKSFDLARIEPFAAKLRQIRNRALAHDDIDDLRRGRDVWTEQELLAGELIACTHFAFDALDEMLDRQFGERIQLLNYDGGDAEELARLANKLELPGKWAKRLDW